MVGRVHILFDGLNKTNVWRSLKILQKLFNQLKDCRIRPKLTFRLFDVQNIILIYIQTFFLISKRKISKFLKKENGKGHYFWSNVSD